MADSSIGIKDQAGATKTMSVTQDTGNTNYLMNKVSPSSLTGVVLFPTGAAAADGASNAAVVTKISNEGLAFNGTTWDRVRGCTDSGALITITGAVGNANSGDLVNYNATAAKVVLDVTNVGTCGGLTLTIQGKDAASGKYYTLLAGASVSTNSTNVYSVGLGGPVTTNVSANSMLPRNWRVVVVSADNNVVTYTVGSTSF